MKSILGHRPGLPFSKKGQNHQDKDIKNHNHVSNIILNDYSLTGRKVKKTVQEIRIVLSFRLKMAQFINQS